MFKIGDEVNGNNSGTIDRKDKKQGNGVYVGYGNGWGWRFSCLENYKLELINKKKIMTSIKTFVKNLVLSADEKLMRKHGLKTDCGEYTTDAKEVVINKLCLENEADLVSIAKGLEAEEEKSK